MRRAQAVDEVTHQLVRVITNGDVEEGDRLPSEHELGNAFGVSRPVIREALRGLRSLGFVVSKAGSGTYVASTAPRPRLLGYEIEELYEVRRLIEVPGAGFAACRASEEQLRGLQDLISRMADCQDRRHYAELDAEFHVALARCSANALHVRLVQELHGLIIENSDLVMIANESRRVHATSEHRQVLDAVVRRDAAAAEEAMLRHLTGASEWFRRRSHGSESADPGSDLGGSDDTAGVSDAG